jgi:phage shock protein PspC (stress-responsive transcriptional regulator)
MLGGVCAGIAEWLRWEPAAGRFLFALITVMSFIVPGIIVYALLWVVLPAAEAGPE